MAIERPPAPSVGSPATLKAFRPPPQEVARYYVVPPGKRETLETVARAAGYSVKELIAFNFPGSVVNDAVVPGVVNWYLHHHVEFDCPETKDRLNRVFKGGERIAIPLKRTYIEFVDPIVFDIKTPPKPRVWFGGGYKGGQTFGVVGNETAQIICISSDGRQAFTATVTGSRFPALGIGASGGPIAVLITSMKDPYELRKSLSGGKEYSLALGAKLDDVFGAGKYARATKAISDFAAKHGDKGLKGLKHAKTLVKYNSQITDMAKNLGMKFDAHEPQVYSLGSPWGGFGVEVSYHFTVSEYHVEHVTTF